MRILRAGFLIGILPVLPRFATAGDIPIVLIEIRIGGDLSATAQKALLDQTNDAVRKLLGPEMKLHPSPDNPNDLTAFGYPLLDLAPRQELYRDLGHAWGDRIRIQEQLSDELLRTPSKIKNRVDREILQEVFAQAPAKVDWDGASYREKLPDKPELPGRVQRSLSRGRISAEQVRSRYWSQRQIYDALANIKKEREAAGLSAHMDIRVLTAQVWQESRGDTQAKGRWTRKLGRALGIAQFMRETGSHYGLKQLKDFFDPMKSLRGMFQYMEEKYEKYNGKMALVVASYNPGPSIKPLLRGVVPKVRQTVKYVRAILTDVNSRIDSAEQHFEIEAYLPKGWSTRPIRRERRRKGHRRYRYAGGLLVDEADPA